MERFTRLFSEIDASNRTLDKVAAVGRYFAGPDSAPAADAAWGLYFLSGRRPKRAVNGTVLRACVAAGAGLPGWMIDECYDAVGDLSETLALLLPPGPEGGTPRPLHEVCGEGGWIRRLGAANDAGKPAVLAEAWAEMNTGQRLVFHKLISGTFRVGVARTLLIRALAQAAGVETAVMAHRLSGEYEPTEAEFRRVMAPEGGGPGDAGGEGGGGADMGTAGRGAARPYPFCLAYQLDVPAGGLAAALGPVEEWQIEWKWDGIRAQLIRRAGETVVWSRGEELVGGQFPEVAALGERLPEGTVVDGEILAWDPGAPRPRPFSALQRRLNRKGAVPKGKPATPTPPVEIGLFGTLDDRQRPTDTPVAATDFGTVTGVPVAFVVYDLLQLDGEDTRAWPLERRRTALEGVAGAALASGGAAGGTLRLSPLLSTAEGETWEAVAAAQATSRERGAEGLMLKRRASPYGVGRTRGEWWKWKVDPFSVDAVLIYAQPGSGKRASLYTDYTFGVWTGDQPGEGALVPFAKAYSGLTDEEIREVDAFVRRNTTGRMGPVRTLTPELVFELGFEGIAASTRHKSGVAVRFPRMLRWRKDKRAEEADTLGALWALVRLIEGEAGPAGRPTGEAK